MLRQHEHGTNVQRGTNKLGTEKQTIIRDVTWSQKKVFANEIKRTHFSLLQALPRAGCNYIGQSSVMLSSLHIHFFFIFPHVSQFSCF